MEHWYLEITDNMIFILTFLAGPMLGANFHIFKQSAVISIEF